MGYQLETTALISKWNYNTFRIRCIMLILDIFKILFLQMVSFSLVVLLIYFYGTLPYAVALTILNILETYIPTYQNGMFLYI